MSRSIVGPELIKIMRWDAFNKHPDAILGKPVWVRWPTGTVASIREVLNINELTQGLYHE